MKRLPFILFLAMVACGQEDEQPANARTAAVCRLVRMEQPRQFEVSLRDELSYREGKLLAAYYYTKQVGEDKWEYVERRDFTHKAGGIDIKINRPTFAINGSFVLDSQGNLVEYSDDFHAHVYLYSYDGTTLNADDRIRYVVRNYNIVERID